MLISFYLYNYSTRKIRKKLTFCFTHGQGIKQPGKDNIQVRFENRTTFVYSNK